VLFIIFINQHLRATLPTTNQHLLYCVRGKEKKETEAATKDGDSSFALLLNKAEQIVT